MGVITHGMTKRPIYKLWVAINQRCSNPKATSYDSYGGSGVRVEWTCFEDFYADMGDRPKGMQIDRIESAGNYSKENCRWATPTQNILNRRKGAGKWSSDLAGVSRHTRSGLWRARIRLSGKPEKSLGVFPTQLQAAIAYNRVAKIHGHQVNDLLRVIHHG